MFVDPLWYEVTKIDIRDYVKEILKVDVDEDSDKWGTAEERLVEAQQTHISKAAKKKVENVVKKMLQDTQGKECCKEDASRHTNHT